VPSFAGSHHIPVWFAAKAVVDQARKTNEKAESPLNVFFISPPPHDLPSRVQAHMIRLLNTFRAFKLKIEQGINFIYKYYDTIRWFLSI
jgi:hypothetical protein